MRPRTPSLLTFSQGHLPSAHPHNLFSTLQEHHCHYHTLDMHFFLVHLIHTVRKKNNKSDFHYFPYETDWQHKPLIFGSCLQLFLCAGSWFCFETYTILYLTKGTRSWYLKYLSNYRWNNSSLMEESLMHHLLHLSQQNNPMKNMNA